mmetsp:Transcript_5481/g.8142  ORF Transcript_5481/g.8142 Transcript_5481/m.8142 type:complete len:305 (+) Transcript_5481:302-1216(+)
MPVIKLKSVHPAPRRHVPHIVVRRAPVEKGSRIPIRLARDHVTPIDVGGFGDQVRSDSVIPRPEAKVNTVAFRVITNVVRNGHIRGAFQSNTPIVGATNAVPGDGGTLDRGGVQQLYGKAIRFTQAAHVPEFHSFNDLCDIRRMQHLQIATLLLFLLGPFNPHISRQECHFRRIHPMIFLTYDGFYRRCRKFQVRDFVHYCDALQCSAMTVVLLETKVVQRRARHQHLGTSSPTSNVFLVHNQFLDEAPLIFDPHVIVVDGKQMPVPPIVQCHPQTHFDGLRDLRIDHELSAARPPAVGMARAR